jgi:long-chain acyl-CoA synthetase
MSLRRGRSADWLNRAKRNDATSNFAHNFFRQSLLNPDDLAAAFPDLTSALDRPVWTVPGLLKARANTSPDEPALWALYGQTRWQSMTWRQFHDAVISAARGLRRLGLQRGDRVGIIAPSSPHWDIAQFAAMEVGGVVVGLDPNDTDQRLAQVAAQCGLVAVIAHDEALLARLGPVCRDGLRFVVTFMSPKTTSLVAFAELTRIGGVESEIDPNLPRADDVALIVFTSGTTGEPKGIAYTHEQVCGAVASMLQAFSDIEPGSRLACWLPLSNLFQRMINLCAVGRGAQIFYVEDPRDIMRYVVAISPHLFIGVPRFYEKLHAGIHEAIDAKPAWQRALVHWAIREGERRARALRSGVALGAFYGLTTMLADRLVLRRIRSMLGEHLRYLISGSAPMPVWLLERFHGLGFLVLEAYGMSESIVPVAANRPDRVRFGTVGQPLPASEIRLAADGELLLRGPGVFGGYLGEPASADHFDAEGFLASGDYASIDAEGFVTLRGRKSEVFKTSTGRRIAPALTESHLRQIPYVEHAVAFGASQPFLIAVIATSEAALRKRLGDRPMDADPAATAAAVRADIASALAGLPGYQRPAGVVLTVRPLSVADGHVTPNLKVRRANVEASFRESVEALFDIIHNGPTGDFASVRDGGTVMLLST